MSVTERFRMPAPVLGVTVSLAPRTTDPPGPILVEVTEIGNSKRATKTNAAAMMTEALTKMTVRLLRNDISQRMLMCVDTSMPLKTLRLSLQWRSNITSSPALSSLERSKRDGLEGTTLRVYRYMVKRHGPVRMTDIQTDLGLSSPSLAHYHVMKLVELGLVREEGNGYMADRAVIENYFRLLGVLVPFQAAYSAFFVVTLAAMLWILAKTGGSPITSFEFIALSVNAAALVVSAYELRRTLRGIP